MCAVDAVADETETYDLALTAQDFSRTSKKVVDDKLAFSATLMRAGEVHAANRLLAEVEHEVLTEEVALIEKVNEVRVARSMRRERITRLRLARSLAVAMLGASVLCMSAIGTAVASFIEDRQGQASSVTIPNASRRVAQRNQTTAQEARDSKKKMRLRIGDVRVMLNASQMQRIRDITGGTITESSLEHLLSLLPDPLAAQIQHAVDVASAEVKQIAPELQPAVAVKKTKKKVAKAAKAADKSEQPADAEPKEEEQTTPSPEPQPEPTEPKEDDEGDGTSEEEEDTDSEQSSLPDPLS